MLLASVVGNLLFLEERNSQKKKKVKSVGKCFLCNLQETLLCVLNIARDIIIFSFTCLMVLEVHKALKLLDMTNSGGRDQLEYNFSKLAADFTAASPLRSFSTSGHWSLLSLCSNGVTPLSSTTTGPSRICFGQGSGIPC